MNRRAFLRFLGLALLAFRETTSRQVSASHPQNDPRPIQFVFAQLRYRGGDWNPHPLCVPPLMEELMARTSVEAATAAHEIELGDPEIFHYPFLYIAGKYDFEPFGEREIETLRLFLSYGGFLLADDALGQAGYGFDRSFRREMKRVFPGRELKRLPAGHALLRSYYLIRRIGGVRLASPYLEGIQVGSSTPVVYSHNDLGGAWERDPLGRWVNSCTPGGEEQRRDAFHLGVNTILYALTENYKEDLIHVPFIRKRLQAGR